MEYEYLASVQSAVRRVNDRLAKLQSFVGNSPMMDQFKATIDLFFRDNYRFKGDTIQLIKPAQIYQNEDMQQALKSLEENIPTYGELKKEYEPKYKEYERQYETGEGEFFGDEKASMGEFISQIQQLPQALVFMYPATNDKLEKAVEIMKTTGRKKTYEELSTAIRLANEGERDRLTEGARSHGLSRFRR